MKPGFEIRKIDPSKLLVLLDPGHGIDTWGKRSHGKKSHNDGLPGIMEWYSNRDFVRRIYDMAWSRGIQCVDILLGENLTIPLKERVRRANALNENHRCIFISVHSNAAGFSGWSKARGFRVFHKKKASKATAELASLMRAQISLDIPEWRGKSFIKKKGFTVIKKTTMPAVLTENGFMTNRDDCILLEDNEWRDRIANAHVQAISDYIEWAEEIR